MDLYDRAKEYDRLFSWDVRPERAFILHASDRWGVRGPRRFLEPFCGTGRLLRAMPGRSVGFDRNPHAVRYAHEKSDGRYRVFRADAGRFALHEASFDCAFCLIDSFRYLTTGEAARDHLGEVAHALRPGAIYVLGFNLVEGDRGARAVEEWTVGELWASVGALGDVDPETRIETALMRMGWPGERVETVTPLRTYTGPQVRELVEGEGSFEIAAACRPEDGPDPGADLDTLEGSVYLVLRKPV